MPRTLYVEHKYLFVLADNCQDSHISASSIHQYQAEVFLKYRWVHIFKRSSCKWPHKCTY